MKTHTLSLGQMQNSTYIVENQGKALLIDPTWDMPAIYTFLQENKLTPEAVIFTHGHYDHVFNAKDLLEKFNLKAIIHEDDITMSELPENLLTPISGDLNTTIIGLPVEIMHTPGHSKGSISIKIDGAVFTGDTLFAGACGRTDLPGSDVSQMQKSLERLAHLPPETIVYAGHSYGEATTIGQERKTNPFIKLSLKDPKAFGELL